MTDKGTTTMSTRNAPFTAEEVSNLNAYQQASVFHPFTCGNDSGHPNLIAQKDGWICPECSYRQNWAWAFMADASWKQVYDYWAKERDTLGRVVRDAWIRWAKTQPNPKLSWLVPYDGLSEADKEADRQIGEAVKEHLGIFGIGPMPEPPQ